MKLIVGWCIFFVINVASADVVRDGSIGPDSSVQPSGPNFVIEENMGQTTGTNLFHSFSEFDLTSTQSASFTATSSIDNVVTRVTGGTASQIDGSIISNIPGAHLFFINPNGVVLGQNAAITVDGDVHISTANRLQFDDDDYFSMNLGDTGSVLSIANPSTFGFLGDTLPAAIQIDQSHLTLKAQSQFSLVGGETILDAGPTPVIDIAGGKVNIISVAGAGDVPVAFGETLPNGVTYGDIRLTGTGITTILENDIDDAPDPMIVLDGSPGGQIFLRGDDIRINDFSIATHNLGSVDAQATGVKLEASNRIVISGNSQLSSTSESDGRAGDVLVKAQSLLMQDDAEILSDTFATAPGGEVRLEADEIVMLDDAEVGSDVEGSGDGGVVTVITDRLSIAGEAEISTDTVGSGRGGSVSITASESVILTQQGGVFSDTQTSADAGDIVIDSPLIKINGVEIEHDDDDDEEESDDDNEVDDDPFESAGIYSISNSTGSAGDITINTDKLRMTGESAIAASALNANGGNIEINASEHLMIRDSGIIADVNEGVGGNISIDTRLAALHQAEVVARAGDGQGGAIVINADQYFSSESLVSASAGPAGISGTVTTPTAIDIGSSLAPPDLEIVDSSTLLAQECDVRGELKREGSLVVTSGSITPSSIEGLRIPTKINKAVDGIPVSPAYSEQHKGVIEQALQYSLAARENKDISALDKAKGLLASIPRSTEKVYLLLHIANTLATFHPQGEMLLTAHQFALEAKDDAESLNDTRTISFSLGNLAGLYAKEHRYEEALLLTHQALQSIETERVNEAAFRWYHQQGKYYWALGRATDALSAFQRAVDTLTALRLESQVDDRDGNYIRREIMPVYTDLLSTQFEAVTLVQDEASKHLLLQSARENLEKIRAVELREYFNDPCIAEVVGHRTAVDNIASDTAVVYPIVLPDELLLLVSYADKFRLYRTPVSHDEIQRTLDQLLARIQKVPSKLYRGPAKKLYRWIIAPLESDLNLVGVSTLVFVPAPELRTLPLAALYDGKKHLVEKFSLAVVPSLDLVDPTPISQVQGEILLAGLSESVDGSQPLPTVEQELAAIADITGEHGQQVLLNRKFLRANLQNGLAESTPRIVHIASHASFDSHQDDSYVLSFDGKISMNQLKEYIGVSKYRREPLELLVLSACQTAAGDQQAALGLAGVAIQSGARSALGSLWKISDDAALLLVKGFYQNLGKPGSTKASALQRSQIQLLQSAEFDHPYYWSPFLIISNWL